MDFKVLKQEILAITEDEFRNASDEDISSLVKLNIPDYFVEFIKDFEPLQRTFVGDVRLLPINEIIEENEDYVPGADIYPKGFTVFASTITGDAYCFDMTEKNKLGEYDIYYADHDNDYSKETVESVKDELEFVSDSFINLMLSEIEIEKNEGDLWSYFW